MNKETRIAVIGLGYVGLPLARLFATKFPAIGFDINSARDEELRNGHDSTLEVEDDVLQSVLLKSYQVPTKQLNGEKVLEFARSENELEEENSSPLGGRPGGGWSIHYPRFRPFQPGLVGGHCIGVDPYYLAQKAQELGYHPEIILAGRRMNDSMGKYVASEVVRLMLQHDLKVKGANILVLGITFKENCPDVRNTKVVDVVKELQSYGTNVTIYYPLANPVEVMHEYNSIQR